MVGEAPQPGIGPAAVAEPVVADDEHDGIAQAQRGGDETERHGPHVPDGHDIRPVLGQHAPELPLVGLLNRQRFAKRWVEAVPPVPVAAQSAPYRDGVCSPGIFSRGRNCQRDARENLYVVAALLEPLADLGAHHLVSADRAGRVLEANHEHA